MCGLMPSIVLEHRFRSKRPSECKHLLASWDAEPEDEFKDVHDPLSSCKEAITGPEADQWQLAMQEEMDSLAKNGTWTMERNTGGQRVVDNRWVFKRKLDDDGNTTRYKARMVARGFSQVKGVDYNETFIPVMRTLMALAAAKKLKINFFDVKTAFLHGELKERVLMRQP